MPAENKIFSRGTYFLTLDCSPVWITFDYEGELIKKHLSSSRAAGYAARRQAVGHLRDLSPNSIRMIYYRLPNCKVQVAKLTK